MDVRFLRYFLAVAQQECITKAAEVLHITQPTLSRQIAQAEEELGVKLFARGTRRLSLTTDGLLLRRRAEEILELVDKTERELAEQFHLNANYCCALFNKDTGGSFSEYLTSIRMKEAERLLTHTTLSLEEIAVQCGIQDYYYFNKVFKKYSGATPSQYRKQRKNPENRAAMEEI